MTKFRLIRLHDSREFNLLRPSTTLGRSESCDIQITTGHASRKHARIDVRDDGAWIEDLDSTNGTFVNNEKIEGSLHLRPGDVIRFDEEAFSLQREDQPDATIFASPFDLRSRTSKSLFIDEEESDLEQTFFHQGYRLQRENLDDDDWYDASNGRLAELKAGLKETTVAKSLERIKDRPGIVLVFFIEYESPVVFTLTTISENKHWTLGRRSNSDIHIANPCISETHAFLKYQNGQWLLEDNHSTNGVWHERKKISSVVLGDNMVLNLGAVELNIYLSHSE